jgi:hypothetical protein
MILDPKMASTVDMKWPFQAASVMISERLSPRKEGYCFSTEQSITWISNGPILRF